jgi:murein DD-endopeptidase MepM/ murein hydrolase activator NlpD
MIKGGVVLGIVFALGYLFADFEAAKQRALIAQQQGTLANLQAENSALKSTQAALDVQLTLSKARTEQYDVLRQLQAENLELKRQVSLYKDVLGADDSGPLRIQELVVQALSENNTYHLQFLLMQGRALKAAINGNLKIAIHGRDKRGEAQLLLADLLTQSIDIAQPNSDFRYRYQFFMEQHYTFALPDDFVAHKVVITTDVYQWKSRRAQVEKNYLWSVILDETTQVLDNSETEN